jgi:hypothetical protein
MSLVNFATINLCVTSQHAFVVSVFLFRYRLSPETFGYISYLDRTYLKALAAMLETKPTAIFRSMNRCFLMSSSYVTPGIVSSSTVRWLVTLVELYFETGG